MRKVTITLAAILLVLAALSLATDAALMPYAGMARIVLPKAIPGVALLLFLALLVERPKAAPVRTAAEPISPATAAPTARWSPRSRRWPRVTVARSCGARSS